MDKILSDIREDLLKNVSEKALNSNQNFFKEKIKLYGVSAPIVSKLSKKYYKKAESWSKAKIFLLCEKLWQSGYIEESFMACNLSYYVHEKYEEPDFAVFERWTNIYVNNWASCDTLCNHTVGDFIMMYPKYINNLKSWAKSENRWMKRGAAVTLIIPARKGLFLTNIFEIADILMNDKDELVQKGYGWMLKAASEAHLDQVYNYVTSHKSVMPRTAYRYALEKMPLEMRAEAMKK